MITWPIILTVWGILLALFLIGNKRWGDRMARMDADMEQAFAKQNREELHKRFGRKYG